MRNLLLFLSVLLFTAGCSRFQKLQKSQNIQKKYEAAQAYYEEEDYYRAGILLEDLIPLLRGKAEGEKAQYLYANCHFHQNQLVLSAYYFKNFYETFPRSELVEEARFMHARSLYQDTPNFNLDQSNSFEALSAIDQFMNRYPNSAYIEKCEEMRRDLNQKLEEKAYENAKLYFKLSSARVNYLKSAIIAFDNFLGSYPDSKYGEEITYLKVQTQYNLAKVSVEARQEERYYQAIEFYEDFIDTYPESRFAREAESIYENARQRLVRTTTQLDPQ